MKSEWAHTPRDAAFDKHISDPAFRLLTCLHTLAYEQNPERPSTAPMTLDELRSVVGLFGKTQFHKNLKDLRVVGLIRVEMLPGRVSRVIPEKVRLDTGKPVLMVENRTEVLKESLNDSMEIKDSKYLGRKSGIDGGKPVFNDSADPAMLEVLRLMGVSGKARSLIALNPKITMEGVRAYDRAVKAGTMDLRLAVYKMKDGDVPPEVCKECGRVDGDHQENCATHRKSFSKGWFDD